MTSKSTFKQVVPGLYSYAVYDESIKAEVTSHVVVNAARLVLIDPVEYSAEALAELGKLGVMDSIILSTENHVRATPQLREKFNVRVFIHENADPTVRRHADKTFTDLDLLPGDLTAIHIPGSKPTETAFFLDTNGGVLILGDALLNLGELEFLPEKYCNNSEESRRSLKKLLVYDFKVLCFGHGAPLKGYPKVALRNLLLQKVMTPKSSTKQAGKSKR